MSGSFFCEAKRAAKLLRSRISLIRVGSWHHFSLRKNRAGLLKSITSQEHHLTRPKKNSIQNLQLSAFSLPESAGSVCNRAHLAAFDPRLQICSLSFACRPESPSRTFLPSKRPSNPSHICKNQDSELPLTYMPGRMPTVRSTSKQANRQCASGQPKGVIFSWSFQAWRMPILTMAGARQSVDHQMQFSSARMPMDDP